MDLNENPEITDKARCLHTRYDLGVTNGKHKGERSGILVEEEPRAIINPFKENTRQNGRRIKEPNEPMFTLTVTDRHGIVWTIVNNLDTKGEKKKIKVKIFQNEWVTNN